MKTVNSNNPSFQIAAAQLSKARKLSSESKKLEDSAKDFIKQELLNHDIKLDDLVVGDTVIIKVGDKNKRKEGERKVDYQDCIRITIKTQNKVDNKKLNLEFPAIAQICRKDFPCTFYDSLIDQTHMEETRDTLGDIKLELEDRRKELQDTIRRIESLRSVGVGVVLNNLNNKKVNNIK